MGGGQTWPGEFGDAGEPEPPARRRPPRTPGIFGDPDELVDEDFEHAPAGGLELSSIAVLIPTLALVPVSGLVVYPVWRLLGWAVDMPPFPICFAAYVSVGFFTDLKPVQRLLLAGLFAIRQPTRSELSELEPAWEAVLRQAGIDDDRFLLTVVDSPDISAAATGGSVVPVTTGALDLLPADELEGVLAHELGHHVGLHDLVLPLAHWLAAPIAWLGEAAERLSRLSCLFTLGCVAVAILGIGFAGIVFGVAMLFLGLLFLVAGGFAASLGGVIGRFSEYAADRAAVDLGFGDALSGALDRFSRQGMAGAENETVGQRIFGSHPPIARRLNRVHARMARRGEG